MSDEVQAPSLDERRSQRRDLGYQRRKQYQNCDYCRQRRRACDAVKLGADPLLQNGTSDESSPVTCSVCRKSRRKCTFEWLRALPRENLPRGVRERPTTRREGNTRSEPENPVLGSQLRGQSDSRQSADDMTTVSGSGEKVQVRTTLPGSTDEHTTILSLSEVSPAWELSLGDLNLFRAGHSSSFLDGENADHGTVPGVERESYRSLLPAYDSVTTGISQPLVVSKETNVLSTTTAFESCIPSGISQIVTETTESMILQPVAEYALRSTLPIVSSGVCLDNVIAGGTSLTLDPRALQRTALNITPISHTEIVNHNESRLSRSVNNSLVMDGLTKIYRDTVEMIVDIWFPPRACSFLGRDSTVGGWAAPETAPLPGSVTSLYQRVHQLDHALAPLRPEPLTVHESNGVSRALKLAMMAFASEWSSSPQGTSSLSRDISDPATGNEPGEALEFERLLRRSLWNEADRCISRWSGCDSFRLVLAIIMFGVVQRPLDEDELHESQELGFPRELPEGGNDELGTHASYCIINPCVAGQFVHFRTETCRKSNSQDSAAKHFHGALRNLLTWTERIRAFRAQNVSNPAQQEVLQACSSFNVLFWFGVAADTKASVLTQSSPVIPVEVAELDRIIYPFTDGIPQSTRAGLMDPRSFCQAQLYDPLSQLSEQSERTLQDSHHSLILLWRRVGILQELMSRQASPSMIESGIRDALEVYQHWNTTYGAFFQACLDQQASLSFKIQSWHCLTQAHWHLACLRLARCIEQIDEQSLSAGLQRALRLSSFLVLELQKTSAYAIANLAQMSGPGVSTDVRNSFDEQFHESIRHSPLLTEPWTELLIQAFKTTCELFFDWLRFWQSPSLQSSQQSLWVASNVNCWELYLLCGDCIDALTVLGRKSEAAIQTGIVLHRQLRLLENNQGQGLLQGS